MAMIRKRGNSYLFRVSVGYDASGKQIERTKTWKPPDGVSARKADKLAKHEAELFEEKVLHGMIAVSRVKFEEFTQRWMKDYAMVHLRPKTLARYEAYLRDINHEIGYLYLDTITPAILMEYYKKLAATPKKSSKYHCTVNLKAYLKKRRITKERCSENSGVSLTTMSAIYQGKNVNPSVAKKICLFLDVPVEELFERADSEECLSPHTVLHYHRLISSIMQKAVRWQLLQSNPCERVDPPKAGKIQMDVLDVDDAIRMVELLDGAPIYYRTAIIVLLFTGMRRGELLGLEWPDINFSKNTISITKTSQYLPGKGLFDDETKNSSSERVIKAPKTVMKALFDLHHWQMEQQFTLEGRWEASGKVITSADGSAMRPDTLSNWFRAFIDSTDLPAIHLHSLRHTNATLAIANGVAVTTVAGQLGHADANTTTKIYAHAIKSAQAEAADMMDDLLTPKKKAPTMMPMKKRGKRA